MNRSADKKTAFVTGASYGVGAATALALARHGFDVAVSATRAENLDGTVSQLEALGVLSDVETLVLCGDKDLLTPPHNSQVMADALPDAELQLVPGAGHMVILERPAVVNGALLDLLDRATARAASARRVCAGSALLLLLGVEALLRSEESARDEVLDGVGRVDHGRQTGQGLGRQVR